MDGLDGDIDGELSKLVSPVARALVLDRCYVRRIMDLALLAPGVVEAVVEGRGVSGVSLEKLLRGTPMLWAEQRGKFGVAGRQSACRKSQP